MAPDASTARVLRYQLAHSVDKVRQLEPSPLARMFAGGEAPFVVRGYFQARALWFPGPVPGLRMLEERAPDLLATLARIATGPDAPSSYLAAAAELALDPVGGLWRDDEAFVVGWDGAVRRDDAGERWAEQQLAPLLHVADEHRRLA